LAFGCGLFAEVSELVLVTMEMKEGDFNRR
jgi:hypothetical protein